MRTEISRSQYIAVVFSNWQLSLKSEHKDKIIVLTTAQ